MKQYENVEQIENDLNTHINTLNSIHSQLVKQYKFLRKDFLEIDVEKIFKDDFKHFSLILDYINFIGDLTKDVGESISYLAFDDALDDILLTQSTIQNIIHVFQSTVKLETDYTQNIHTIYGFEYQVKRSLKYIQDIIELQNLIKKYTR